MKTITGVAPSSSLGIGFDLASFKRALDHSVDFIGQDAGSTDMGPYYHGMAKPFLPRATYKHDLKLILLGARERGIPLIIGSALTSGSRATLQEGVDIIEEIAREESLSFRMAIVDAELDKSDLKRRITRGGISPLGIDDELTPQIVDRSGPICAQMGPEPLIRALDSGADVVVAGRACDDAIFAAMPIMRGFDAGLALHMGKILECAGMSALPTDPGEPMIGTVGSGNFVVKAAGLEFRCTPVSVAAHSLYERGDPCIQPGPGGINDLTHCEYRQFDERSVEVTGSRFVPTPYAVKLEGAQFVGYRSIILVGVRDAIFISQIGEIIERVRARALDRFSNWTYGVDYTIELSVYGVDGIMAGLEPERSAVPKEISLLINVVAKEQELANGIAMFTRGVLQHISYPGMRNTAGNLAYPFSPFNIPVGPAYQFSVYHLLPLADPCEIFPMTLTEIRN